MTRDCQGKLTTRMDYIVRHTYGLIMHMCLNHIIVIITIITITIISIVLSYLHLDDAWSRFMNMNLCFIHT